MVSSHTKRNQLVDVDREKNKNTKATHKKNSKRKNQQKRTIRQRQVITVKRYIDPTQTQQHAENKTGSISNDDHTHARTHPHTHTFIHPRLERRL